MRYDINNPDRYYPRFLKRYSTITEVERKAHLSCSPVVG